MLRNLIGWFKSTCELAIGLNLLINKSQELSIDFIEEFIVSSWFHTHISDDISMKNWSDNETADTVQESESLNCDALFEVSEGTNINFL